MNYYDVFGYYLVEKGLVTMGQVLEALDRQREKMIPIGKLARQEGKLTEEQVYQVLSHQREMVSKRQCLNGLLIRRWNS